MVVTAENDNPTITSFTEQTIRERESTAALSFSIDDVDGDALDCTTSMTAESSNTTIIPNGNLVLAGTAPDCTITATAVLTGASDNIDVTLTVDDGQGGSAQTILPIIVNKYCSGDRLTNSPYANSGEAGIDGSESNPYSLCLPAQLNEIGGRTADWDSHFELTDDIDIAAYTGITFQTIGVYEEAGTQDPFTGSFEGNNFTIANFTHEPTPGNEIEYARFFGYILKTGANQPTIQNVNFTNASVEGEVGTGVIVAYLSTGDITNCSVTILGTKKIEAKGYVGGVAGYIDGTSNITNTEVYLSDTACIFGSDTSAEVGGLIGSAWTGTTVSDSSVTMDNSTKIYSTNTTAKTGGLIGYQTGSSVSTSSVRLSVDASIGNAELYVGGMVGYMTTSSSISNSTVSLDGDNIISTSTDSSRIGGLVGYSYSGCSIANSSVTINESSQITSTGDHANLAGFVGRCQSSTIHQSLFEMHDTSTVYGQGTPTYLGGLTGWSSLNTTITESIVRMNDSSQIRADTATGSYVGGLSGWSQGPGVTTIRDSYVEGTINASGSTVGGLVGVNKQVIKACFADIDITGTSYVGGLVGMQDSTGGIYGSFSTGSIIADTDIDSEYGSFSRV